MKRTISLILLLCSVWIGMKAAGISSADNDTVMRMTYPDKIEIRTEGDSLIVKAGGFMPGQGYGTYTYTYASNENGQDGNDWEVNLPFVRSHREDKSNRRRGVRLTVDWFDNLYVGGVTGARGKPKGMRGGWEIGVDNLAGVFLHTGRRGPVLSLGMGLGYRGINYGGGRMLSQKGKRLVIVTAPENLSAHSRLHLFRLAVPFMVTQPLVCDMALRVGAILNLNTYTSATTKTRDGHKSVKQSFHSLEQRFATPDLLGTLVLGRNLGLYVRWSPVSLYSSDWGPCCRTVSFGVSYVL